jgi:citronellol/citronellal dehydrogenase
MAYDSVFRPSLFQGQIAVVTGGGSGIGRCVAHELAALGANIALVGRKEEKLLAVQREIEQATSLRPTIHPCDIREEDQVKSTVVDIIKHHGRIGYLVNNAGGQFPAELKNISQKGWETVVRTNLTGGFLVARECFIQSMEANGGAIVNVIADMWMGMPIMGHSGAARAGMLNFTETAAVEWAYAGVRVNAIAPGVVASSGLSTYPDDIREGLKERWREIPLKRLGTESECSAAIVFLLSPAAAFISGTCLRVDGGEPNGKRRWSMPDHQKSKPYLGFPLEVIPDFLKLA